MNRLSAAASEQSSIQPPTPNLRDLIRYPNTSHTLQDLAYLLATALQATSAYICDWNATTNESLVLAEYTSEQATPPEKVSDLNYCYSFRQGSQDPDFWLKTGEIVIDHLEKQQSQLNSLEHLQKYGGKSVLGIPLKINLRVVGFAEIWESRHHREFTEDDIRLARTITQQVGLALENIALFEAQQHQLQLAQTLQEMGALLTTDLPLEQVYEHVFRLLQTVIPYDGASIQLLDSTGQLYPVAAIGILNLEQMRRVAKFFQVDVLHQRWQDYPAAAIPDTHTDPRWILIPELSHICSWVGAALYVKDTFIGLLDLCHLQTGSYNQTEAEILLTFANQAAIAITNARLFVETRRQAQELTGLHETALATGEIMEIGALLSRLHQQVQLLLNPDGFYVALYDDESEELLFYEFQENGQRLQELTDGQRYPVEGLTGWIVQNRRSLFIGDLTADATPVKPIIVGKQTRAWLGVPLLIRERIIGVISIQSLQPHAFSEADHRFLQSMANQVATTIDNVQLFEAEARRRQEAELLSQLAASLTHSLELDDLLQQAVNLVAQQLPGVHNVVITLLDKSGEYLRPRVYWHAAPQYVLNPVGSRIPLAETYASQQAIRTRAIVIVENAQAISLDTPHLNNALATGISSALYVPIVIQDKPVGVLHVNVWDQPRKFRADEVAFCQGVAYQIANAHEITRLFAAERRQLHLAQTLQQVGSLLTTHLSLDEVYEQLFHLLQKVVDFDAAAIFLLNETGSINRVASYGNWTETQEPEETLFYSPQFQEIWQHQPFLVISEWQPLPNLQLITPQNMHSWVGAALLVKGQFVGTLNVYSWEKNAYTQTDGEVVASFANQAAIAIVNTRLHEAIKQGANELAVLYQVSQLIVSIIDVDELLSRTTKFLAEHIYPHIFGFLMLDEAAQQLTLHPSFHGLSEQLRQSPLSLNRGVVGHVARTGHWYIVEDVQNDPLYVNDNGLSESEIAVPLKVSGKIIGVIQVKSPHKGAFTEHDVRFLTTLAGQVAAAIERIQIHLHLADMVAGRTVALQEEQDRLEAILEGAGEGIFFTDPTGNVLYANKAALDLIGLMSTEVLGHNLLAIPTLQLPPSIYEAMRSSLSRGKRWSGELLLQVTDERKIDTRLTLAPLYNVDYGLTGFVGIQSDISRLKEVERLKSEFVTNVSHELRTPLTNIITSTTLLERGKPEKRTHYLHVLKSETNRLTRLVNSLLDLSWLETSESIPYLQPVDLQALLGDTLQGFHFAAQSRRIILSHHFSPTLPNIQADTTQLSLALRNLLENAFAYTPVGGHITVTADMPTSYKEPIIRVKICDDGVGIPEDELTRVFDRFFRGRASLTLGVPGTGLGLTVARHIIEQHYGWIEVESQEDEGTTVTVWLPPAEKSVI